MHPPQSKLSWALVLIGPAILLLLLLLLPIRHFSQALKYEPVKYDLPPTVILAGDHYRGSSTSYAELPEGAEYLGELSDCVPSDQSPVKDFQANDPLDGCPVYRKDSQTILVEIDGAWWSYYLYKD